MDIIHKLHNHDKQSGKKNVTNYDLRLWEVLVDYHLEKQNYQTKHSYATQHSGKSAKYMTILTGFL